MTVRVARFVCAIAGFLIFAAAKPAYAQAGAFDAAFGYSFLHENELKENFPAGWFASVSGGLNRWFSVAGEVVGNAKTFETPEANAKVTATAFGVGPRFVAHSGNARPFAQVLFGGVRGKVGVVGLNESETDFAWIPGAGLDVDFAHGIGVRFAVNGRFIKADSDTTKEFNFLFGILFSHKRR